VRSRFEFGHASVEIAKHRDDGIELRVNLDHPGAKFRAEHVLRSSMRRFTLVLTSPMRTLLKTDPASTASTVTAIAIDLGVCHK